QMTQADTHTHTHTHTHKSSNMHTHRHSDTHTHTHTHTQTHKSSNMHKHTDTLTHTAIIPLAVCGLAVSLSGVWCDITGEKEPCQCVLALDCHSGKLLWKRARHRERES